MEKQTDHVGAGVPIAYYGNRRIVLGAAGRSRPDASRSGKPARSHSRDPPTTHPAQLPDPTAKFTEYRGRERVRLCRNLRYCWGACHKGLRRHANSRTHARRRRFPDLTINTAWPHFGSIPARPNLAVRRDRGVYHDCAWRHSARLTLRHRIKRVPWSFRRARNLTDKGRPWEDDMAVDTVVDAELWLILAAMIGWVVLGCFVTSRHSHHHHTPRQSSQH
jgi:hypothetical protein